MEIDSRVAVCKLSEGSTKQTRRDDSVFSLDHFDTKTNYNPPQMERGSVDPG